MRLLVGIGVVLLLALLATVDVRTTVLIAVSGLSLVVSLALGVKRLRQATREANKDSLR